MYALELWREMARRSLPMLVLGALASAPAVAWAGLVIEDGEGAAAGNERLATVVKPRVAEWVSGKGETTLRAALQAWADRAGWHLQWAVMDGEDVIDYPLHGVVLAFSGTVDQAVVKALRLYLRAEVPMAADVSLNGRFIRVTAAEKTK